MKTRTQVKKKEHSFETLKTKNNSYKCILYRSHMDLTAFAFIFYTNITSGYTGTDKSLHPRIFNTHNLPAKKPPQLQRLNEYL